MAQGCGCCCDSWDTHPSVQHGSCILWWIQVKETGVSQFSHVTEAGRQFTTDLKNSQLLFFFLGVLNKFFYLLKSICKLHDAFCEIIGYLRKSTALGYILFFCAIFTRVKLHAYPCYEGWSLVFAKTTSTSNLGQSFSPCNGNGPTENEEEKDCYRIIFNPIRIS